MMIRLSATTLLLALGLALVSSSAFAQLPAGPGQMPGTLPPAPTYTPPPPPVAPPPVRSVVTPLPSPTFGVPPGVTRPVVGTSSTPYRYHPSPRRHYRRHHRPGVS
jgi:hypothetical protein